MKKLITTFGLLLLLAIIAKAQKVTTQVTTLKKITEYDNRNLTLEHGLIAECNGCEYEDTIRYFTVSTTTKVVDSLGNVQNYPIEKRTLTLGSIHGDLKGLNDNQVIALYLHPNDSFINRSGLRSEEKYHASGMYPLVEFNVEIPKDLFRNVDGRVQKTHFFAVEKKSTSLFAWVSSLFSIIWSGLFFGYAFFNRKRGFWKEMPGKWKELPETDKMQKGFRRVGFPVLAAVFLFTEYLTTTEHLTGHYYKMSLLVLGSIFLLSALMAHRILRWLSKQEPKLRNYIAKRRKRNAPATG